MVALGQGSGLGRFLLGKLGIGGLLCARFGAAFVADARAHFLQDHGGSGGGGGEGLGVFGGDVHQACGGDGVLVGGEEDEFPFVFLAVFGDEAGDLVLVVVSAGVFESIG